MAHDRRLRPIGPNDGPTAFDTVLSAANAGSRRDVLVAMRTRISAAIDDEKTPARDLAALTKRLMDVAVAIDDFDAKAQQEASENADATGPQKWDASAI